MLDFWWQIFCRFSPGKRGVKFVTENFTTFFTSRKEICHLELTLRESSPKSYEQTGISRLRRALPSQGTFPTGLAEEVASARPLD